MALQMTVDQFVAKAYLLATGKVTALTFGSTKYSKILALANLFTQEWATEDGVDWNSLRTIFDLGTVTATDTFDLDTTIGKISSQEGDFVRILHTDGVNESDYTIVPASRLYNDGPSINNGGIGRRNAVGTCAVVGSQLVFSTPFVSTNAQFGGSIKVPGFAIPKTLVGASDKLTVDDPNWLCYIVAAEYDRNDITRVQLYPSLKDRADELMEGMKRVNGSQAESVYTVPLGPAMGESW